MSIAGSAARSCASDDSHRAFSGVSSSTMRALQYHSIELLGDLTLDKERTRAITYQSSIFCECDCIGSKPTIGN